MNPLGRTARIVVAVALFVALILSFVSSFLVMSIDFEDVGGSGFSAGFSAWHRSGVLGGLAVAAGLPVAVVASALPTSISVVRRILAAMAGAACLAAIFLFVLYLVLTANDMPGGTDDLQIRFGWSGYATLAVLAIGAVAAVVAVVADPPAGRSPRLPTDWA